MDNKIESTSEGSSIEDKIFNILLTHSFFKRTVAAKELAELFQQELSQLKAQDRPVWVKSEISEIDKAVIEKGLDLPLNFPLQRNESPVEQPVVDTLSDDQFPDLSSATPEQKAETINGLVELCAKNVLKMFYAFGLKTHIECTVVNDPTNETFDFIFRKRTAEQPVVDNYDTLYYMVLPVLHKLRHRTDNDTRMLAMGSDIRNTIQNAIAEIKKLPQPKSANDPPYLVQSAAEQPGREVMTREQFDNWHLWLSNGGYTFDGEYYYDEENNFYTTAQLWEVFKKEKV